MHIYNYSSNVLVMNYGLMFIKQLIINLLQMISKLIIFNTILDLHLQAKQVYANAKKIIK